MKKLRQKTRQVKQSLVNSSRIVGLYCQQGFRITMETTSGCVYECFRKGLTEAGRPTLNVDKHHSFHWGPGSQTEYI